MRVGSPTRVRDAPVPVRNPKAIEGSLPNRGGALAGLGEGKFPTDETDSRRTTAATATALGRRSRSVSDLGEPSIRDAGFD